MGIFKDVLKRDESLMKNELALDFNFVPKVVPFREVQQRRIASAMKPLVDGSPGRNMFIYGPPGTGKTVACKSLFDELEEETDIYPVHVNCWRKNTSYQILTELCHKLGYKFTLNKRTDELFEIIKNIVNKKAAVFCFDEVDKVEDLTFLYHLLDGIYKRSIILITNDKGWINQLEDRLKSRLLPEVLEFHAYSFDEIKQILTNRIESAFFSDVWDDEAINIVSKKSFDEGDIRKGIYLLRESALIAQEKLSEKVTVDHAGIAVQKLEEFQIRDTEDLEPEAKKILEVIKKNSNNKIGDLFKIYKKEGGLQSYKTFQRRIDGLSKGKFISVEKVIGKEGNTSIIQYGSMKKLTDF